MLQPGSTCWQLQNAAMQDSSMKAFSASETCMLCTVTLQAAAPGILLRHIVMYKHHRAACRSITTACTLPAIHRET